MLTTISCDYCWARTSYWKYDNHGARVCQDEQECLKSKERRMDDTIIALHAMGRRVYGDDWLDVGPKLIWRFSGESTRASHELERTQLLALQDAMYKGKENE